MSAVSSPALLMLTGLQRRRLADHAQAMCSSRTMALLHGAHAYKLLKRFPHARLSSSASDAACMNAYLRYMPHDIQEIVEFGNLEQMGLTNCWSQLCKEDFARRIDAAIDMAIIRRDGISPGISLAPG